MKQLEEQEFRKFSDYLSESRIDADTFPGMEYDKRLSIVTDYLGLDPKTVPGIKQAAEFLNQYDHRQMIRIALKSAVPAIMVRNNSTSLGSRVAKSLEDKAEKK
jgi:hypothetical protein